MQILGMFGILIVVSFTAGHFMFILKNSSSLIPRAVLRGPWFQQSGSGCTMTFWSATLNFISLNTLYICSAWLFVVAGIFICRFITILDILSVAFPPLPSTRHFSSLLCSLLFQSHTVKRSTSESVLVLQCLSGP